MAYEDRSLDAIKCCAVKFFCSKWGLRTDLSSGIFQKLLPDKPSMLVGIWEPDQKNVSLWLSVEESQRALPVQVCVSERGPRLGPQKMRPTDSAPDRPYIRVHAEQSKRTKASPTLRTPALAGSSVPQSLEPSAPSRNPPARRAASSHQVAPEHSARGGRGAVTALPGPRGAAGGAVEGCGHRRAAARAAQCVCYRNRVGVVIQLVCTSRHG